MAVRAVATGSSEVGSGQAGRPFLRLPLLLIGSSQSNNARSNSSNSSSSSSQAVQQICAAATKTKRPIWPIPFNCQSKWKIPVALPAPYIGFRGPTPDLLTNKITYWNGSQVNAAPFEVQRVQSAPSNSSTPRLLRLFWA